MERREHSDRSGINTAKCEFVWGEAAERAMGAVAVVVLAVRVGAGFAMSHALEFLHHQLFVPDAAVEALGAAVLPRAARSNVTCFETQQGQPLLERLGNELRAIVVAGVLLHVADGE